MTTRIVFAGGVQIEVPLDLEQVTIALRAEGLSELVLPEQDRDGNPVRVYVNRDQVAFIMAAEPPAEVELPDTESGARQQVTDVWGNPVRPRPGKR
jgi:hypothetical protein